MGNQRSGFSGSAVLALTAWVFLGPGCVERLLQVRSEPPGAEVFVNGSRAGTTPIDVPFVHYGIFDVTLRAPERVSVRRLETVRPPWYEIMPLDFFAENLLPFRFRDHRVLSFSLESAKPLNESDVGREKEEAQERIRSLEGRLEKADP